jgi:hypothetical protein
MDILNFISWIKGKRQVTSVDPTRTLIPVGLKDDRRDDGYIAGAISVSDLQAQLLPYKSYTALIFQNGGDAPSTRFGDGTIEKGITYEIGANPDNEDLTLVGAPDNNVGTIFVATVDVTGAYTPDVELLYNGGAPRVNVLENTLGVEITYEYATTGAYAAILSDGLFTSPEQYVVIEAGETSNGGDTYTVQASPAFFNLVLIESYLNNASSDDVISANAPTVLNIRIYN